MANMRKQSTIVLSEEARNRRQADPQFRRSPGFVSASLFPTRLRLALEGAAMSERRHILQELNFPHEDRERLKQAYETSHRMKSVVSIQNDGQVAVSVILYESDAADSHCRLYAVFEPHTGSIRTASLQP